MLSVLSSTPVTFIILLEQAEMQASVLKSKAVELRKKNIRYLDYQNIFLKQVCLFEIFYILTYKII